MRLCTVCLVVYYAVVLWAALRVLPVRPSVRLSVSPVRAHNSKTKKRRRIKISIDVTHGTDKWNAVFPLKKSKVKVTGRQKPKKNLVSAEALADALRDQARQTPTENSAYAIVRPNSLSAPDTLGRSAVGRTAACYVGTRRRHAFSLLFDSER